MTENSVSFKRRRFPPELKYAFASFSKLDTVPAPASLVSKLKGEGDLLLILRVINFLRFSSQ